MDALVVGGVQSAGFFWIEKDIGQWIALGETYDFLPAGNGRDFEVQEWARVIQELQDIRRECRKMRVVTRTTLGHNRK